MNAPQESEPRFGDRRLPPRIWRRVAVLQPAGCWLWTGLLDRDGYGKTSLMGQSFRAHRLAYLELVGPIPADLVTDHLCRRRACIRPSHIELVTRRENMARGVNSAAEACGTDKCQRGHEMTPENVIQLDNGYRHCRECSRASKNAYKERKRQEKIRAAVS